LSYCAFGGFGVLMIHSVVFSSIWLWICSDQGRVLMFTICSFLTPWLPSG